jgi:hypothetical protein
VVCLAPVVTPVALLGLAMVDTTPTRAAGA